LGLVALAPALLTLVPLSALAAVLLVTGWRLISLRHVRHLFEHHGLVPVGIWAVTVAMVVLQDLLVGVALGLALSIIEIVPYLRRKLAIRHAEIDEEIHVQFGGAVTCKDVPILLNTFEQLPEGRKVRLVGEDLHYKDHTSAETISEWLRREAKSHRSTPAAGGTPSPPETTVSAFFDRGRLIELGEGKRVALPLSGKAPLCRIHSRQRRSPSASSGPSAVAHCRERPPGCGLSLRPAPLRAKLVNHLP
jgi:MFS superfamily sulfate permease-like transporter